MGCHVRHSGSFSSFSVEILKGGALSRFFAEVPGSKHISMGSLGFSFCFAISMGGFGLNLRSVPLGLSVLPKI